MYLQRVIDNRLDTDKVREGGEGQKDLLRRNKRTLP